MHLFSQRFTLSHLFQLLVLWNNIFRLSAHYRQGTVRLGSLGMPNSVYRRPHCTATLARSEACSIMCKVVRRSPVKDAAISESEEVILTAPRSRSGTPVYNGFKDTVAVFRLLRQRKAYQSSPYKTV